MAVTGTKTVRDICEDAARKATVVGFEETMPGGVANNVMSELDMMLKEWQQRGFLVWTMQAGSVDLAADTAVYTLDPVRPLDIHNARYKASDSSEMPLHRLTREGYDRLADKDAQGTPQYFYWDSQREAARLYVYPVLATRTSETIEYTAFRELEDMRDLNATLDVPGEYWSCVAYNLAARLMDSLAGAGNPNVPARAEQLLNQMVASARERSVFTINPGSAQ